MRRVAILATLLPVAALLALLLPGSLEARAVKDGGTFRVAGPSRIVLIDPAVNGTAIDLLRPACGALMGYPDEPLPEGLRLAPELAASNPRVSGGGRTYTFVIRKDARFSTGKPVAADDVKGSLERVLTPSLQSPLTYMFEDVVGAKKMLAGKESTLAGVRASGRTLVVRLAKPVPDFPARTSQLCVVPAGLPTGAEGASAPIPSAAPYYVSQYVPGQLVVLERNTFYSGPRPHHVDRIEGELAVDPAASLVEVANGHAESASPGPSTRLGELARRYGVNRTQFFVRPALFGRSFFLNTSRPLFRGNVALRRAVNFAVDRKELIREFGPYGASPTDQFLPPGVPGFRNARIYPLRGPDVRRARALAAGHTRGRRAVLYTCTDPAYCVAPAQVLQQNLRTIGLRVQITRFPVGVFFQKAGTAGEPYDMILLGWAGFYDDPREFMLQFDSRSGAGANFSRFESPAFDRELDRASSLSGRARYEAYGRLDVQLARDEAPAIPYAVDNIWAFVSANVRCVVMNPGLDLTAVCLK